MTKVYLQFVLLDSVKKTSTWSVQAENGGELGVIGWWGAWRKYTFFPKANTLFDASCLRSIADRCEAETRTLRESWRKSNKT